MHGRFRRVFLLGDGAKVRGLIALCTGVDEGVANPRDRPERTGHGVCGMVVGFP